MRRRRRDHRRDTRHQCLKKRKNNRIMSYTFLDELTYADIAFEAQADTLEELFISAALATTESMVALDSVEKKVEKNFSVTESTEEALLFSFLEELVIFKDSEQLFLTAFKIRIEQKDGKYHCKVSAKGDTINTETQELHNDVKAVTMHHFTLEHSAEGWKATVILDV
ncbi:archease [Candidatus Woesearchaeota archaeon]|nr:archease [Candidatus Woesearchaeota archaeon]